MSERGKCEDCYWYWERKHGGRLCHLCGDQSCNKARAKNGSCGPQAMFFTARSPAGKLFEPREKEPAQ